MENQFVYGKELVFSSYQIFNIYNEMVCISSTS